MNPDVFLSLLALDSYNRGYGANVGNLAENGLIGNASIRAFQPREQDGWEDAGFYAIAYRWNGETIISYRGTNFPQGLSISGAIEFFGKDFLGGWDIFTGVGNGSHAELARDFYVAVTGHDFVGSDTDPIATRPPVPESQIPAP